MSKVIEHLDEYLRGRREQATAGERRAPEARREAPRATGEDGRQGGQGWSVAAMIARLYEHEDD